MESIHLAKNLKHDFCSGPWSLALKNLILRRTEIDVSFISHNRVTAKVRGPFVELLRCVFDQSFCAPVDKRKFRRTLYGCVLKTLIFLLLVLIRALFHWILPSPTLSNRISRFFHFWQIKLQLIMTQTLGSEKFLERKEVRNEKNSKPKFFEKVTL